MTKPQATKPKKPSTLQDVLKYSREKRDQKTVKRYYLKWREEQGIPLRCDNPECRFHSDELTWNGKPLRLTLDHVEGNRYNNSPTKLSLLCPNCDSQQPTRGGGNRGTVIEINEHDYTQRNPRDGSKIVAVPAGARINFRGSSTSSKATFEGADAAATRPVKTTAK